MFKIVTILLLNLILTKKGSPFDYAFEIKTKICERTLCQQLPPQLNLNCIN